MRHADVERAMLTPMPTATGTPTRMITSTKRAPSGNTVLQVEQAILAQNDHIAAHNLSLLNRHHTRGFNSNTQLNQ